MNRALVAARKSTKVDGGEGLSLDTQDEYSRVLCERLVFTVVGVARDTISGRVAPVDRKSLGAWLATPERFDVIVAYKSDRLSRGNDMDWSRIETWAADHGKTLILVDSGTGIRYPARDDSDFWQWQAAKRQAGQEWEAIRERNIRSNNALQASGAFIGRAPYGYRIVGAKYAKRLEVVEALRPLIVEIFAMAIAGSSLAQIALWLESQTGAPIHTATVMRIIFNWAYAGRLERNGTHYADCPPVVDAGTLAKAQRCVRARSNKPLGGRPSEVPALLVLTCGECAGKMYRRRGVYVCSGSPANAHPGCGFRVPLDRIDGLVVAALSASTRDEMTTVVIPAEDHADQVERLRRDRRAALERDDIEAVTELTAEMRRLEALPVTPERVERVKTGRKVGQKFAAMTRVEMRAELKAWKVTAYPNERLAFLPPWESPEARS